MTIETSSFRDNSGFIFYEKGEIFRAISRSYKENYEKLIKSGLYDLLVNENLIIPHTDNYTGNNYKGSIYKIIKPQKINFISYPYEWCFSQLKDAALTTLNIQKSALKFGMSLKDCSAYNIQFHYGKPVLIDTLSFEIHKENEPWIAYNQFCRHFLAPLAMAALCDVGLLNMLKNFIDGIPLDTAKNILRKKSLLKPGIFMHINLHSSFQRRYNDKRKKVSISKKWVNKNSLFRLTDNLLNTITGLRPKDETSNKSFKRGWGSYYSGEHHTREYFEKKKDIVKDFLNNITPGIVWDIGANEGEFSKIAGENSGMVISFDSDHNCIESLYNQINKNSIQNILPLIMDFTNPSCSIGWANSERKSLSERVNADLVLALAIIHHLCISNNVPLKLAAEFFSRLSKWLIIEFIPKEDPMVKKLLLNREDIFHNYNSENFEKEFGSFFYIVKKKNVSDTGRVIYLMKKGGEQNQGIKV